MWSVSIRLMNNLKKNPYEILRQRVIFVQTCKFCCRFPFDWRNPFGYFFAVTLECAAVLIASLMAMCVMAPVFGSIFMLVAVAGSIKCSVVSIRKNTKRKRIRLNTGKQLFDFIGMQSKSIRLGKT